MEILVLIILVTFIIGTVIGSFLNVVALRGLTGESIILPSSKCPHCGNKIKPWHNIPILSYLFLRGKCAYCNEPISIQYPIVELLTGLLIVACLFKFGPTISTIFTFICCCTLIVMSITDIRQKVICAGHAWFLIILGIAYSIYLSINTFNAQMAQKGYFLFKAANFYNMPITTSIIGLLTGIVVMEILAGIGKIIIGKRAFGVGDTFIAAGLGAFFGWKILLYILIASIIIQVCFVLPGFFKKLAAKKDQNTIISLILFILAAVGFTYAGGQGLLENFAVCIAASIILFIIGVYACFRVIKGIKEEGDLTVLPFGPAMTLATFILLFFVF